MPQTPRGIVYPDSSGSTQLWEHLESLADTADAAIDGVAAAFRVKAGSVTVATSASAGTVPHGESSTPIFACAEVYTSSAYVVLVPSYTASALNINVKILSSGANAADGNYPIRWMAVFAN